ncbi:hypothetical protein BASA83_011993 [Batrachochytrium salamandrivorans]|nr:hypothetical protein BASA83_011993 [Batrachochytrium salamandrivorans]
MSINNHTQSCVEHQHLYLDSSTCKFKQHSIVALSYHAILYLVSFVVVASYAAALPQPAGLSEKYSNGVDITLASILEARSYQPVSNTQEGFAYFDVAGTTS